MRLYFHNRISLNLLSFILKIFIIFCFPMQGRLHFADSITLSIFAANSLRSKLSARCRHPSLHLAYVAGSSSAVSFCLKSSKFSGSKQSPAPYWLMMSLASPSTPIRIGMPIPAFSNIFDGMTVVNSGDFLRFIRHTSSMEI